jgi:hypothetical protein
MTCSAYAATVFNSGLLRSISRSGGDEAHSHVGEGHVAVVGMGVWRRASVVENGRRNAGRQASRMHGARERRANVKDMMQCGESGRGKLGDLYRKPFRSQDDVGFGHNGARSKDIVHEILTYKPGLQEICVH